MKKKKRVIKPFDINKISEKTITNMKRRYRIYLQDSSDEPNFEIDEIENFEEFVEDDLFWERRYKREFFKEKKRLLKAFPWYYKADSFHYVSEWNP